jgi:hypothetical protein
MPPNETLTSEQIAEKAAERALEKFAEHHVCRFSDGDAKKVHFFVDKDTGVDFENIKTLVTISKTDPKTLVAVAEADPKTFERLVSIVSLVNSSAFYVARILVIAAIFALLLGVGVLAQKMNLNPFK